MPNAAVAAPQPPLPLFGYTRLGGGATGKKQDLCYYVDAQCLILVKTTIILYTMQAFILLKRTSNDILHMDKLCKWSS